MAKCSGRSVPCSVAALSYSDTVRLIRLGPEDIMTWQSALLLPSLVDLSLLLLPEVIQR